MRFKVMCCDDIHVTQLSEISICLSSLWLSNVIIYGCWEPNDSPRKFIAVLNDPILSWNWTSTWFVNATTPHIQNGDPILQVKHFIHVISNFVISYTINFCNSLKKISVNKASTNTILRVRTILHIQIMKTLDSYRILRSYLTDIAAIYLPWYLSRLWM